MFEKNQSDEGVSPVVGVILMVAITVILSAIIATFVLDLGGTVSQNPQAGVTFDQQPEQASTDGDTSDSGLEASVQAVSLENADSLSVSVSDNSANTLSAQVVSNFPSPTSVGDTATLSNLGGGDKITVTATLEGKTQVIQTYTVEG